jgi:hypothetical protein
MVEKKEFIVSNIDEEVKLQGVNKTKADDCLELAIVLDVTSSMHKWI